MVKTIQLKDSIYKHLSGFGSVGQSFGEVITDLMEFAEENEDEYDSFLENKYADEDENEEDEDE